MSKGKGQGDPLGIFVDKTGFWTRIEGEEGYCLQFRPVSS
jgi:hypothetical protein